MNTQKLRPPAVRNSLLTLAAAMLSGLALAFGSAQGVAYSQHEGTPADERRFENTVPAHVPIKVKLKSEKSFKDLKNKGWARELEIEVKNTGTKPIYYLNIVVDMPDFIGGGGNPTAFQVKYGRGELVRVTTPLEPDDKPILPGESVTLKISESQVRGYEAIREMRQKEDPKKVEVILMLINFGDGTSIQNKTGTPMPDPARRRSQSSPHPKEGGSIYRSAAWSRITDPPGRLFEAHYLTLPASLLRADFYPANNAASPAQTSPECNCQNSSGSLAGED